MSRHFFRIFEGLLLVLIDVQVSDAQVTIIPGRETGIYHIGETAKWVLKLNDQDYQDSIYYLFKKGGLTIVEEGKVTFSKGICEISYSFVTPGTVLLEVWWGIDKKWQNRVLGGGVAEPEKIPLSCSAPDDFDDFWKSKLKELKEVPANPELEKDESGEEGINYYKIRLGNIRGTKIYGQLARPEGAQKLPALLIVQWAGVYPLDKNWVISRAKEGWLVLNIMPHDLPMDQAPEFYKEKALADLMNYPAIGNDNRETSYFLRMYLSCYRAAEYLASRDDWNGKTLVVTGDSQGGMQSLVTASLYKKVTACMALVPAGFDFFGPAIGREGGWPKWYHQTEGKNPEKVRETGKYYDVVNFIPDIKCPVLVGLGLLDETCPPEGILAGLNQFKGKKEVIILPGSAHQEKNGSQEAYKNRRDEFWLPALKKDKKIPSM
jgi:cephalosporin-C deacetylase-like acetyl esterase